MYILFSSKEKLIGDIDATINLFTKLRENMLNLSIEENRGTKLANDGEALSSYKITKKYSSIFRENSSKRSQSSINGNKSIRVQQLLNTSNQKADGDLCNN